MPSDTLPAPGTPVPGNQVPGTHEAGSPVPGAAGGSRRRRRASRTWLGTLPLLVFATICFGVPVGFVIYGAVTTDEGGTTHATGANLSTSLHGAYLTSLTGSVELSALTALIGCVLGMLIAQAVITSRGGALRESVLTASGVLANFGGVPLAFAFVATLGISGVVTQVAHLDAAGWNLYSFPGLVIIYLYFLIPLMVLVSVPALDGLRPQWREAAQNAGATLGQFWRHVGIPVLAPTLLGGFVLLFGSAFAAYATAAALVGGSVPLVTLKIADALSGNVQVGQENVALALSLDMIVIAGLVMAVYLPLQRRSTRWLH